jgi:hypothetical protein
MEEEECDAEWTEWKRVVADAAVCMSVADLDRYFSSGHGLSSGGGGSRGSGSDTGAVGAAKRVLAALDDVDRQPECNGNRMR